MGFADWVYFQVEASCKRPARPVVDFLTLIINLEIRSEVNGPETADLEAESYPNSQVMSQTLPSKTPLT